MDQIWLGKPVSAEGLSDDEVFGSPAPPTPKALSDDEVFGSRGIAVPDGVPAALDQRLTEGHEARQREGGLIQTIPQFAGLLSSPDGRTRLWDAVKSYPAEFVRGMADTIKAPGDAAAGTLDPSSPEGMDRIIGLGALVAFGRLGKLPVSGKTSGLAVAMGQDIARISRGPMGEVYDLPVGRLPVSEDFATAAAAIGGEDAPRMVQKKMLQLYQEEGLHPSEIAHDAQHDPIIAQKLLSSVDSDLPLVKPKPKASAAEGGGGGEGRPPEPPPEPTEAGNPEQKILSKISIGESPAGREWTWDRLYTQAIDDLHPLQTVSEDAYELARLTRGQFGKAEHFLEHGTFDFNSYKTNGKPLKSILAPVSEDLNGLRAYLASKRAIEIEADGRASGLDLEAAQSVVTDGTSKYEGVARDLSVYQTNVLKYLRDSGVLSDKSFDAMQEANKNYVPFYRVIGGEQAPAGAGGRSFGPGNPIKRLKGSEREIIDPLESIIKNTYAYVSIAERNAVGVTLIDALKEQGFKAKSTRTVGDPDLVGYLKDSGVKDPSALVDFIKSAAPEDGETLRAFRNGVREEVEVHDPELVRAFHGLDAQSTSLLTRIFSVPARALRAGAVLTPDFMARNLMRDFLTAFINTKGLVFSPVDSFKGLYSTIAKDSFYQDWLKSGGANATMVSLDRRYMQENLAKLSEQSGGLMRSWNVVTSPITGLRMLSELIENSTRVGEFRKDLQGQTSKDAIQSAGYASREVTLDFARVGASMRAYNMVTAFANAQIQGVDRIVRAFADRPVNTSLKVAGGITLPSVLLWWANHDDARYKELPAWQKDLFWIVLTKDHIWRIPKPFELGVVFGSGVERALDATIGGNKEAFDNFSKSVMQVMTPNYIPTAVQPIFEQWANRSTFSDRTLIPADLEKHLPEYQYTPYTTELSKKLGQIISAFPGVRSSAVDPGSIFGPASRALTTPILIENYIRSWTGGLGAYAMEAADAALRKTGALPDPIKPTPTLADIPFIKAFAVRYPSATTESIQRFYDEYSVNKKYYDTWMSKAQEGDAEALVRIQNAGGARMFVQLDAFKETLSEHSKLIRDIYKNPSMPAPEKRQLIDTLYDNMIKIGQAARETLGRVDEGIKAQPEANAR